MAAAGEGRGFAIAIVGVGAILPDAPDARAFWENVKRGRYSISDVTPDRWDPDQCYDPDPAAPAKTYSRIGGFVREWSWDPIAWKLPIPPRVRRRHGRRAKVGGGLHAGRAARRPASRSARSISSGPPSCSAMRWPARSTT